MIKTLATDLRKVAMGDWCTATLNTNVAVAEHRDRYDYRDGLCVVMVLGDWGGGGELVLEELGVTLHVKSGDVVFFRSYWLTHYVKPFSDGKRHSVVLFTHNSLFHLARRAGTILDSSFFVVFLSGCSK